MAEKKDGKAKSTLSLSDKGTLSLKLPPATGETAQSRAPGRPKTVEVEVRKTRSGGSGSRQAGSTKALSLSEKEARLNALKLAQDASSHSTNRVAQTSFKVKPQPIEDTAEETVEEAPKANAQTLREKELSKLNEINNLEKSQENKAEKKRQTELDEQQRHQQVAEQQAAIAPNDPNAALHKSTPKKSVREMMAEDEKKKKKKVVTRVADQGRFASGRLTVNQALNEDFDRDARKRSLASQRRALEKERMKASLHNGPIELKKHVRDVKLPETITVQELANRMTERVKDVVRKLMQMDVMATSSQTIDADIAEIIIEEFGHTFTRVSEADVEDILIHEEDDEVSLKSRPPIVTIMGHVDHGKTSLLDTIRKTRVTSGEAGGITQHIGAYQVTQEDGNKITFIDTPGHAAFTEMRARGADVTDLVILVVAANDSVMPQTIEAINHAKAADKLIIVAINKCDLPDADPAKVKTELLQHEIFVEDMGGDTLCLEVSAKTGDGLDELLDSIMLQSEMLELKANPDRKAVGSVIESKLDQGRGAVATILIQHGTLNIGDIFVSGSEWGKVRALNNESGKRIKQAIPGQPVEVIGLNGTPNAGEDFVVVDAEAQAREIADFRIRKTRTEATANVNKGSLEELMSQIQKGEAANLDIVIKGDVHGSIEALVGSLTKLTEKNDEVKVNILHQAVGGITESDVTLANASNALILGFNVRANTQARALSKSEGVDIRYYSIIYEVIDDVKLLLSGMLSPELKETFIGYAEMRQIFNITKVGKVAGCMVTDGIIKRGAKVRLLRDDVVIHEGELKTLQRFKDEVKDVREGFECGMAFENYDDIKEGDVIEAFEITEETRSLDDVSS